MNSTVLLTFCFNVTHIQQVYRPIQTCTGVSDSNYANSSLSSRAECALQCTEDEHCKSFSFFTETLMCYLNQEFMPDGQSGCSTNGFVHFNLVTQTHCLNGAVYDTATNNCRCINGYVGDRCERLMKDCTEGYDLNYYRGEEGLFWILPDLSSKAVRVRCQMLYLGRTCLLSQTYNSPYENFTRGWDDYKNGFGDLDSTGNFYIGNDIIHLITNNLRRKLLIEAIFGEQFGTFHYRQYFYGGFKVRSESENYRLTYDKKIKAASVEHELDDCFPRNNIPFSTIDRDNDADPGSCAQTHMSGWWFDACGPCNPTGKMQDITETRQRGDPTMLSIAVSNNLAVREVRLFLNP